MIRQVGCPPYSDRICLLSVVLCLAWMISAMTSQPAGLADILMPTARDTLGRGSLDTWAKASQEDPGLIRGGERNQSGSPSVIVSDIEIDTNSGMTPAGTLQYDDSAYRVLRVDDLWVDANNGDDANDGLTLATAFRTIQRAADVAGPGTIVHIMPGIYREAVWPAMSGSASAPVVYVAEDGPGTAIIRGSEPARSLNWTRLTADTIGLPPNVNPADIYYADLSAWELDGPPRFVVELNGNRDVLARLPLAREPDWNVVTEWKYHEFWWAADGGSDVAGCDPITDSDPDCDLPWRSTTQLTDRSEDSEPFGIEPGDLTTLGDLTGATLVAIDDQLGHWVYRRSIIAHDATAGRITVDEPCELVPGWGDPGLGWGSKYYVEGRPYLLDTPGEWWYDEDSERLYLWPRTAGNPSTMNIEISQRDNGFSLKNRSYLILDGLTIEFLNENAIYQDNHYTEKSYHNTVRHATLRYANRGLRLGQWVQGDAPAGNVTDGFTLEDSEIAFMDTDAIYLNDWWENDSDPDSYTHSGVLNTVIRNNELHHLGFRTDWDDADGAVFTFAHRLRFEGNHVHHVAHNGVQFLMSVIQSPKEYGFAPSEIKTGEILIKDNVFEQACQLTADCGALKIWGTPPDNHVFRDMLITGNIFRDTFGWAYVSEKRRPWWPSSSDSDVQRMGGFGLYVDMASGVHAYRNIAYNNALAGFQLFGVWQDGDVVYYNNIAANSLFGLNFDGLSFDTHGSINTQVVNNIIVNNEGDGIRITDADGEYGNLLIDHNLYYNNGWRAYEDGGLWMPGTIAVYRGQGPGGHYQTLADIQANTAWEAHGVDGSPGFWEYDITDHNLTDGSWPDFHLTPASPNTVDRGTTALPTSLATLLDFFDVDDRRRGIAFDIGRYESGFDLLPIPSIRMIVPGEVARYALSTHPFDLPYPITLTISNPASSLTTTLSSNRITSNSPVTLTVANAHTSTTITPGRYTIPITGTSGGFTQTTNVELLVCRARLYLPLVINGPVAGLEVSSKHTVSIDVVPDRVSVRGPSAGVANTSHTFVATLSPSTASQPITYTWQATELGAVIHTSSGLEDAVTFTWATPGLKVITVTASNATGKVSDSFAIALDAGPARSICLRTGGLGMCIISMLCVFAAIVRRSRSHSLSFTPDGPPI